MSTIQQLSLCMMKGLRRCTPQHPRNSGHYVSVRKRARSETETVAVKLSAGEFIQYLVSSPCTNLRFSLADVATKEMILHDRVPATILEPPTFTRLWPVVGDRPQQESSLVFAMSFAEAGHHYTFQVQHRRADGTWGPLIDVDFEASEAGDTFEYQFRVLTN